jgi:hypothetical protein
MAESLALSTTIKEPKTFTVDGEPFKLLGIDHLSKDAETEALALFSRHQLLVQELSLADRLDRGKAVAERVKKVRLMILCKLTNMPKDVAEKLPLGEQVKLLEALQEEIAGDDDVDEAADEEFSETDSEAREASLDDAI